MKNILYSIGMLLLVLCSCTPRTEVFSPNGNIKWAFSLDEKGGMSYQVSVNGKPFIGTSALGFAEKSGLNLSDGFQLVGTSFDSQDETWTQPWGENKSIRSHYNEMAVNLKNEDDVKLTLRVRVFDDGLGFRYEYDSPADSLLLMDEYTSFNIVEDGTSWSIPAEFNTYELLYRTMPLSEMPDANTPMTFKTKSGIYASIHEAALTDFPEMCLKNVGGTTLKSWLAAWPDKVKARFDGGKFQTAWRSIQIADKAVGLINSGLILNLNEPCVLEGDLSWIRPMKYVGVWWGMHLGIESWVINDRHGATTENTKKYIDFAAANNIEGVLVEGWNQGWETWGRPGEYVPFDFTKPFADFDIDELARYAKEKGVELLGHHETGADIPNYEAQLDRAYQWTKEKGINHLKTGYAGGIPGGHHRHSQYAVRHYRKAHISLHKKEVR